MLVRDRRVGQAQGNKVRDVICVFGPQIKPHDHNLKIQVLYLYLHHNLESYRISQQQI